MSNRSLQDWALPQLSRILPLDDDSLRQIVDYAASLSKPAAANHLKEILGDSTPALEFISSFNTRRQSQEPANALSAVATPSSSQPASSRDVSDAEVPRAQKKKKKARAPLHALPARQVEQVGDLQGGYVKREQDDYMTARNKPTPRKEPALANTLALESQPEVIEQALPARGLHAQGQTTQHRPKPPPSASGPLITDALSPKPSRSSSPAKFSQSKASAKVNMTGGTSMRGQSEALNDLDSAIRSLEMQTNPALSGSDDPSKRRCNCMAQRHALLAAAPNCTKCGKIICAKEGLGPCTFCGTSLLSPADLQAMVAILREERGHERQQANNAAHKRADVAKAPRAFAASSAATSAEASGESGDDAERAGLAAAKQHRDRLLRFQAENARRTQIHDEAADFATPDAGLSQWATPAERARQLKKQQKVLREQQWAARPEWEKRRVVASIDLIGGRAVRRMADVERPTSLDSDAASDDDFDSARLQSSSADGRGGAFSRNPLLKGGLVRPVYVSQKKGKARQTGEAGQQQKGWRRVQDDGDGDNEAWILDGGVYGDGGQNNNEHDGCG